ncbi:MAG: GspE/PulE family protein [Candidatus Berkelbacteria bacterium]|nr:GspE/PulE family protein [Candidatus Berkelbacteria bacterium]
MPDLNKALQIFSREGEEKVTKTKANNLNLPYVNLVGYAFTPDVLSIIPKETAQEQKVVSFYKMNEQVKVATSTPENPVLIQKLKELSSATNFKFYLYLCSETSMRYGLAQLEFIKAAPQTLSRHVISDEYVKSNFGAAQDLKSIGRKIVDTETSEVLDIVFAGAIHLDASDIHIEPIEEGARLRFRIDGMLQDIANLPKETFSAAISRIKYLSKLKMNIANEPQDGRFDIQIASQNIDVRVSIIPGAYGEVTVMRLLNPSGAIISLEQLGFNARAMADIEAAIKKPNGAIFNTGPTGSGKTTTLYGILQKLNKPEVKIITLEDPIEYRIEGIDQSQINPDAGYDFASGLKHALRQDPDIVMVGEIRDKETAETALQASLTGHLVLTTLHTNSAPSSIPRLIDIGVRPFLLSGSINLIIAQRLVRKACPTCKGQAGNMTCPVCKGMGFKGRVAIIETLKITPKIDELIAKKATVSEFEKVAREDGMIAMFEDGMEKVRQGITTEEEVGRVAAA